MNHPQYHTIREYETLKLARADLTDAQAMHVGRALSTQFDLSFPSPLTNDQWEITSKGVVGYFPIGDEQVITVEPKVPIGNLFRMLEVVYSEQSFKTFSGLVDADTLEDLFERLAALFSQRILLRVRQGLYKEYSSRSEHLSAIRGRMDVTKAIRRPWRVHPYCHYEEHTRDIVENQILATTLYGLRRAQIARQDVRRNVEAAWRKMAGAAEVVDIDAQDCVNRTYNRLNQDYDVLHALAFFFLTHLGPNIGTGTDKMIPFQINMPSLFERFVAATLASSATVGWSFVAQEQYPLISGSRFVIDMVAYLNGRPQFVLDTKYKATARPSTDDISQVVSYAVAKDCRDAWLVYPTADIEPFDCMVGDVRVRSSSVDISADLSNEDFSIDAFAMSPEEITQLT